MAAVTNLSRTGDSLLIHNVTKLDADGEEADFWLLARDGVIEKTGSGESWSSFVADVEIVDGVGAYLTPGFIDIHFHGGGGYSNENGKGAILAAVAAHRTHGTTRSVISLVSNPISTLLDSVEEIAELTAVDPSILGSHLEGPYLAVERKGAHNGAHLIDPTLADVDEIIKRASGTLKQITIDPSRTGALEAIAAFTKAGVVVAVGHTSADYELTLKAFEAGVRLMTHTFNAMPGINHYEPGPIVAALKTPEVFLELIFDGKHVSPTVAAFLVTAAPHRVALITDAMAAAGGADGEYKLGDVDVVVENGTARVAGTSTLAGSTLTLDEALQVGLAAGVDRIALIEALTLTPARILKLDAELGLLRPGFRSDLLLLDDEMHVRHVYVGGQLP